MGNFTTTTTNPIIEYDLYLTIKDIHKTIPIGYIKQYDIKDIYLSKEFGKVLSQDISIKMYTDDNKIITWYVSNAVKGQGGSKSNFVDFTVGNKTVYIYTSVNDMNCKTIAIHPLNEQYIDLTTTTTTDMETTTTTDIETTTTTDITSTTTYHKTTTTTEYPYTTTPWPTTTSTTTLTTTLFAPTSTTTYPETTTTTYPETTTTTYLETTTTTTTEMILTTVPPLNIYWPDGGTEYDTLYDGQTINVEDNTYIYLESYEMGRYIKWVVNEDGTDYNIYGHSCSFNIYNSPVSVTVRNEDSSDIKHLLFVKSLTTTTTVSDTTTTTTEYNDSSTVTSPRYYIEITDDYIRIPQNLLRDKRGFFDIQ